MGLGNNALGFMSYSGSVGQQLQTLVLPPTEATSFVQIIGSPIRRESNSPSANNGESNGKPNGK